MKSIVLTSNNLNLNLKNSSCLQNPSAQKSTAEQISKSYLSPSKQNTAQNNSKISPAYVYEKGFPADEFYGKIVYERPQSKIHVSQQQENSIKALSNNATNSTSKKIIGASTIPSVFRKLENLTNDIREKISDSLKKTEINAIRTELKVGLEALRTVKGNELKYAINFLEHALQDKPSDMIITNEKSELSKKIKKNIDYKKASEKVILVAGGLLPTMKVGEEYDKNKKEFSVTFSKEHDLDLYLAINNANLYFKKENEDTISIWLQDTYNFDNATLKENSIELIDDWLKGKLTFGKWLNEFGQDLEKNHIVNEYEIKIKIETVKILIPQ
ncbi:hypothetical protein B0S90_0770 [Caldicellulosiruptor bescii]|nr:hypothetical protein [Caldicellulosiruptor bescii]PBC89644.1 hypothetical protein B0S87_2772 [Caldicellulosiruptor bescii]PBC89967.1 hypothetical protein B0S89_0274 [Caldicellulosiruptor bescii]PBD04602.1 hypothetical protein B0S85_2274 [Caldicellulosiruptor bescii]PBD05764.1 hypothetical protein B0S90_0770 [Caldicellulosiruptor bescii]PBD09234.1 hypothetical protein B0S84_1629 [Caldicellulosiruptor bescii]